MIVPRDLLEDIKTFLKRPEYIAVIGPRQAGKTVLLNIIKNYLINNLKVDKDSIQIITFEDRRLLREFEIDPISFVQSYFPRKGKKRNYLMIDEFQYAEEGGQRLKLAYDTLKNTKIIITGSSSLEIKAQVGKYLVGRILTFHLYPFNFREFLKARNPRLERIYSAQNEKLYAWLLKGNKPAWKRGQDIFAEEMLKEYEEYCIWGGYPAVVLARTQKEKEKILRDIYNNYILKDIRGLLELATEQNLFSLSQYLATQIGNISIYQTLGQASDFNYRQLKKHLNILKETFIIQGLKPFYRNRQKELSKNPKIFFTDLGFRNSLIENTNRLAIRSDSGAIVENAVFIRLSQLIQDMGKINFWRTKAGAEVDFVLHIEGRTIPIEVKFSLFNTEKVSRSLINFTESFSLRRAIVLTKNFWGELKRDKTKISFIPIYYL